MRAKTPPGLNLKVPRLGINRYGVYYVRSAIVLPTGRRKVSQFSLNTKDASIAKLMALKFCLKLAETDLMHLDKNSSVRYEIDSLSGIVKADGPEEHARAMQALEIMQRAHLERLQLLSTLPPSSASLANELALQIQQSLIGQVSSASKPVIKTKLLKDALNDHLDEEKRILKSKRTVLEKAALFKEFVDFFGDQTLLNTITIDEVTHQWRKAEFNRKNQKAEDQVLGLARLEKRRTFLSKFFDWAKTSGHYSHTNPMAQKMASKGQIKKTTTSWKEFSSEDLAKIFSNKYPTGMNKPDWYWLPLMALYSGARLGELSNLLVSSFEIVDGIETFSIATGKTNDSRRTVPIHTELLKLGLWEYVTHLKSLGQTHIVPHRPDDIRSKSIGRSWGVWIKACGIDDHHKVFHSFRSTAITDLYNRDSVNPAAIRQSVGHSGGLKGSHASYVRGVTLERIKAAIEGISYPSIDMSTLKLKDPTFSAFFADWMRVNASQEKFRQRQSREKNKAAKARRMSGTQATKAEK